MQKFRDYLYCDENRIKTFISQIEEIRDIEVSSSHEINSNVQAGGNIGIAKGESSIGDRVIHNIQKDNNQTEKIIEWAGNKKNAINYSNEKLNERQKEDLIVLTGKCSIPEMSENIEMFNTVAQNTALFSMIDISQEQKKYLGFIKESNSIPLLLENDSDYIFSMNIDKNKLLIPIDDFYDNIGEEIHIIGRIENVYNSEDEVEIYDLSKEVFKLNRIIRRKLPKDKLDSAVIKESGPLVKILPIIIYR